MAFLLDASLMKANSPKMHENLRGVALKPILCPPDMVTQVNPILREELDPDRSWDDRRPAIHRRLPDDALAWD